MALLDLANGELLASGAEPSVVLEPTADAAALAAAAAQGGVIAIRFPTFGDGRGHSLSVLLRERHGVKGEIRAVGYLIPDLAPFLLRSGFDTAEITDANDVETWKGSLAQIRHIYQPGFRNPQPLRRDASKREAEDLNARLANIENLADRIAEVRRSVEGRIAFSTSLGLDDQAILHAVAEFGADIDMFTLDTGRLFPEVLETVELSEIRYGVRIRLVTPEASEVEYLVARDGVFGFRNSVEQPQGLLRGAQGPPAQPRAQRCTRLDHRRPPRAFRRAFRRRARLLGRGAGPHEVESRSPIGRRRSSPPISPRTTFR